MIIFTVNLIVDEFSYGNLKSSYSAKASTLFKVHAMNRKELERHLLLLKNSQTKRVTKLRNVYFLC